MINENKTLKLTRFLGNIMKRLNVLFSPPKNDILNRDAMSETILLPENLILSIKTPNEKRGYTKNGRPHK